MDYRIRSFLSIRHAHGDLCKHLGKDSSTDHPLTFINTLVNVYVDLVVFTRVAGTS